MAAAAAAGVWRRGAVVHEFELNLHSMGRLFLNVWLRYVFDLTVYVHFLAIMISYVLAGSEAWGNVHMILAGDARAGFTL